MTLPVLFSCTGGASSLEDPLSPSKMVNTVSEGLDGEIMVFMKDAQAASALDARPLFNSVPGKEEIERKHGLDRWFVVSVPEGQKADVFAAELQKSEDVLSIEYMSELTKPFTRDEMFTVEETVATKAYVDVVKFNDPLFKSQWFLYNNGDKSTFGNATVAGADVDIRDAWALCAGDPSIVVAVVDEGVKYTHPDLAANMWVNAKEIPDNGIDDDHNGYVDDVHGYNFASNGGVSWGLGGDEGHGTHVAGLVAAVNNNGIGISSVAGGSGKGDGVRIMSCQIFSGSKRNDNAAVANAIKYAADNGACVLQCSFGLGSYYTDKAFSESLSAVKAAYDYFRDEANANCDAVDGNIVIISAGNSHNSKAEYPGAYRDFICVSATSQDNLPAWYTNYGQGVNIASPGGDNALGITMLSTLPSESNSDKSDYGFMHGTSMATPVVSGIAALGLSYAHKLGHHYSRSEYESLLLSSVNSIEPYLSGVKHAPSGTLTLDLANYRGGKMGTGVIDAWKVLMNVEGVPFATIQVGQDAEIDLKSLFGDDAATLAYIGAEASADAKASLGLSSDPAVEAGVLKVKCTKAGCAVIEIKAIAGGSELGSESVIGGKEMSRKMSIVARNNVSGNGGWL